MADRPLSTGTTYIVDAYNLVHRAYREDLEQPELQTARRLLEDRLRRFQATHRRGVRIIVVWDGDRGGGVRSTRQRSFEVIFSRPPQKADDVVIEYARRLEGTGDVCVVTSDLRDIGFPLTGLRCRHMRSEDFASEVATRLDGAGGGRAGGKAAAAGDKPHGPRGEQVDEWLREFGLSGEAEPEASE